MVTDAALPDFDDTELLSRLQGDEVRIDELAFGLVVMDTDGVVVGYNRAEAELSGLDPDRVVGRNFFTEVGPCTNNFMVAQRYQDVDDLDETIDYVFTFRMAPTPVRLRMLASPDDPLRYLAIVRR